MKYVLVAALGLILCAATPRPTPTPTPVALQYVELSKTMMPGSAQPEPGTFSADLAAATGGGNAATGAAPTPAPKRRGIASMVGSVLSGQPPVAGAPPNMGAMMGGMNGRAVRYTFYVTKGWIREDDLGAQRATISKCPQHQFITLNLAAKTYKITDTSPKGCNTTPQGVPGRPGGFSAQPGTMDVTLQSTDKDLGPKTVEGIPTNGTDSDIAMSMTNATGSCMNMKMNMRRVAYISGIRKPRAYCPLVTGGYTGGMMPSGAMGGCKPTMHTSGSGGGMGMMSNNIEMWVLSIFNQGAGSLMERGQVAWLYKPQADPLFAIPKDFTEEK